MKTSDEKAARAARLGLTRRALLRDGALSLGVFGVLGTVGFRGSRAADVAAQSAPFVMIENFSASGQSQGVVRLAKVRKTDAEWRKQLSADSFVVTRQAGTERAFSAPSQHADGLYHCICCDTVAYDSRTKFESGTGWPSFWAPKSKHNIVEGADHSYGMVRTEVSCALCDAHLGHVFDDGPQPTGLRYCMNAVALRFAPRA
jgi:peptide-methionine (R)-S-oxide reductase